MKRQVYLDNVTAILILWMIFVVHCAKLSGIEGIFMDVAMVIMEFFMPWFFFKSGMLYHEKPVFVVIKSNARHLLKPFLIFSLIGWLVIVPASSLVLRHQSIWVLLHDTIAFFLREGYLRGNPPLWFLLSFFSVKVLFALSRQYKISVVAVSLMAFLIAVIHNRWLTSCPAYIGNISNGLFFYTLGYQLRKVQFKRNAFLMAVFVTLASLPFCSYLDFRANRIYSGNGVYVINELFMAGEIVMVNYLMLHWGGYFAGCLLSVAILCYFLLPIMSYCQLHGIYLASYFMSSIRI